MQNKFLRNCEDVINAAAGKVRIQYFPICPCVCAGNYASDDLLRQKRKKSLLFSICLFHTRLRVLQVKIFCLSISPCISSFRKTPKAIICLRISFEKLQERLTTALFPLFLIPAIPLSGFHYRLAWPLLWGRLQGASHFLSPCDVPED